MASNQVMMMATFSSLSQESSKSNYCQGKRGREDPPHELAMGMCATGHWSVMQSCPPIITSICISCSLFTMPHPATRSTDIYDQQKTADKGENKRNIIFIQQIN